MAISVQPSNTTELRASHAYACHAVSAQDVCTFSKVENEMAVVRRVGAAPRQPSCAWHAFLF